MEERGYDVSRFEGQIRRDLLCCFCRNVPEDARRCQNHDHLFCFAHISRHLEDHTTCPTCREHLTPETLRRPTGFIKNYLDDLMINCEYHDRGCSEHVRLESIQNHVDQCEFAPVMCENEGCGMEINKRDKESHEKDFCQFRIVKYRDIKADQEEIMEKQNVIMQELSEVIASQDEVRNVRDSMKESEDEIKANQDEMNASVDKMQASVDKMQASVDKMQASQNKVKIKQDRMREELKKMKEDISGMKRKQEKIDDTLTKVDTTLKKMKDNVDKIQQAQVDMLAKMNHHFIAMAGLMNQIKTPTVKQEIMIMGGIDGSTGNRCSKDNFFGSSNTVEMYNLRDGTSIQLPPMTTNRAGSASCVYNNDVIVVGGQDRRGCIDTIEVLKINQFPQRWTIFETILPVKLCHFDVVVYQDRLIVIGGRTVGEGKISDALYEVRLATPYTCKLLFKMPQPRFNHKAAFVNGKLFIVGGSTPDEERNGTDSVISYNFNKNNEYEAHKVLSRPVTKMSTVTWGNMIIVIGGLDGNGTCSNDVFMYDTETGRSKKLPRLIHKRYDCSAVIIDNEIFVMGGIDDEGKLLDSVESLKIGSDHWKRLAGMKHTRWLATAVVKPQT